MRLSFLALLKKKYINQTLFSLEVFSWFDLYNSLKNINLKKNYQGLILEIGNQKKNIYSQTYQEKKFLKFEHEMIK